MEIVLTVVIIAVLAAAVFYFWQTQNSTKVLPVEMDKPKINLIFKIGIGILLVGTVMPLLLITILKPEGVTGVGLMVISFYTSWISIALIIIGVAKTLWDKRKNKNNIS